MPLLLPGRSRYLGREFVPTDLPGCTLWLAADRDSLLAGNAAQFTAANSEYLSLADNDSVSTGDIDFTWAGWVYLDAKAANQAFISKWATNENEYLIQYQAAEDRFLFYVSNDGTSDVSLAADTLGAVSTATWYFIVAWHDASANTTNIQVNNGTADSAAHATGVRSGAGALEFGRLTEGPANYVAGRLDGWGFWKRTLTANERAQLYNSGTGRRYQQLPSDLLTSLISYWDLEEQTGTRNDSHGTNHLTDNATVTGAAGVALSPAVDGDPIRQWTDLSGYSNHATQSTTGLKPLGKTGIINGLPVVRFDGSNDYLAGTMTAIPTNGQLTMLVVANLSSFANADGANLYVCLGDAIDEFRASTSGALQTVFQSTQTAGGNLMTTSTTYVLTGLTNNTNQYGWVNGTLAIGPVAGAHGNAASKYTLGARDNASTFSRYLTGDLAEVVLYNRALSEPERKRVGRYLGAKHNVAVAG